MNSNGRPTGGYTYKDERQENAVKQSRGGQPPRKKKRRFKPNKDGMLALGALVLIAVIVIILLVLTIKAIAGAVSSGNSDETSSVRRHDCGNPRRQGMARGLHTKEHFLLRDILGRADPRQF